MKNISFSSATSFFSLIAAPVLVFDLKTEKAVWINDKAEELTSYSKDTVNQYLITDFFSTQSRQTIQSIVDIAKTDPARILVREDEIELKRKNGRLIYVSLSATQHTFTEGNLLIMTLEDLTEVKKRESEKRHMLEESARVSKLADIGRLAGGIAHELNNPLAIVIGYVENIDFLLSENKFTKEELRKNLEPIQSSVFRMVKIVSKMMQMIRHESTHFQTLSLPQIVRESMIILEDILNSHSIQFETKIEDCFIRCDSTHVEQIITNIITNACNALEDRKEERRIVISTDVTDDWVTLKIWNNGAAIPDDVRAKMFTPFFTTKAVGEGTGLGLYLCYSIMKAHSGELSFDSDDNTGTTFYLKFPRVHEIKAAVDANLLKALVIDDDTFFRKMLAQKLRNLKLEVLEARNGHEALQIIQENKAPFDLFLVDVKMPKMSGVEFVTKLKDLNPEGYIVMISGYTGDPELQKEILALKAHNTLSKPIQNTELMMILESVKLRQTLSGSA